MRADHCLAAPPRLSFRTHELPEGSLEGVALIDLLAGREEVVSWVHEGRGLIGLRRALTIEAHGDERIEALRAAWRSVIGTAWWRDALVRPGTGPVALGAITFSPASEQSSVLMVPEVLIGLDDDGAWLTTAVSAATGGVEPEHPDPEALIKALVTEARTAIGREHEDGDAGATAVEAGALSEEQWCRTVARTQERMRSGQARKVVLARDVLARPTAPLATGTVLRRLASDYPSTWTFAVDQMVGASPELLLRLRDRRLTSRVLAGTARRRAGEDAPATARLAAWLEGSEKNNREHELARASAITALEPLCSVVNAPARFVLSLPNVLHLASDVTGVVAGDTGALALVDALHPTAAVCGTPTPAAARLIEEAESMDRGRYAGPVGWVDWHGEGEWCIALRSAQLPAGGPGPHSPARVFGGGGIMPDSEPADELAETTAKMRPVLGALGVSP
ncbi:isochorismate synthase [Actinomyces johnsonii]|uniref:isochorismate synthase n=1 Tax=Actinomyces johnsonii TaxID=544581 RepID=A0A508A4A5_9ACTO|nr:isochorismate synthase [Actinomyces johnsonii]KAA8742196.1 isochorismate synthase [Actinomyces johnsonii]TQD44756.1 isochorismate synthase [Actinomyces johnsonii]